MKKLILLIWLFILVQVAFGQNPTVVRPTNGIENATLNTTGVVRPRLMTNLLDLTTQQFYGHDAAGAFGWFSGGGSPGSPTNSIQFNFGGAFTGDADFLYDPSSNRVTLGAIRSLSRQTNQAPSYLLDSEGDIQMGGNVTLPVFGRDANGQFYWRTSNSNIGFNIGDSMGWRGATVTGNTVIGNDDTSIVYYEDATAGSFNHVLPAVNQNNGKIFFFQKFDNTTNEVHICAPSGTLIDNKTNYVLRAYKQSVTLWNVAGNSWATLQQSPLEHEFPKTFAARHVNSKVVTGNALTIGIGATSYDNGQVYQNPAASNDTFRVYCPPLAIGTYTLNLLVDTGTNRGIMFVDMVSADGRVTNRLGTVDNYAAVAAFAVNKQIAGVAITNYTAFYLNFATTNKNASSSDYFQVIDNFWLSPDAP